MAWFEKIAPFLTDPLVLIGFSLLLVTSVFRAILSTTGRGLLPRLTRTDGAEVVFRLMRYLFWLAVLLIVLGFAVKAYDLTRRSNLPTTADVSLCFVNSAHPMLMVIDVSDQVVENAKFMPAVFNLDAINPNEPLHMLMRTFDFIRPGAVSGGYDVFTEINDSPAFKKGDRIVGTVGITCPTCVTGRTFWVALIWGESGWYAQLSGQKSGGFVTPFTPPGSAAPLSAAYIAQWESKVPELDRIPIRSFGEPIAVAGKYHPFTIGDCLSR
jgi:hypothetical protein